MIAAMPVMLPVKRQLFILLLVFLSTIVVAQTVERLESSPNYDDLAREEIFNSNKELRLDLPPEDEWRVNQAATGSSSRIQIGVDPDFSRHIISLDIYRSTPDIISSQF